MKIRYDAEVDALSILFRETTVTTKHLAEGIAVDYDSLGHLAGLEILDAQKRFGGYEALRHILGFPLHGSGWTVIRSSRFIMTPAYPFGQL